MHIQMDHCIDLYVACILSQCRQRAPPPGSTVGLWDCGIGQEWERLCVEQLPTLAVASPRGPGCPGWASGAVLASAAGEASPPALPALLGLQAGAAGWWVPRGEPAALGPWVAGPLPPATAGGGVVQAWVRAVSGRRPLQVSAAAAGSRMAASEGSPPEVWGRSPERRGVSGPEGPPGRGASAAAAVGGQHPGWAWPGPRAPRLQGWQRPLQGADPGAVGAAGRGGFAEDHLQEGNQEKQSHMPDKDYYSSSPPHKSFLPHAITLYNS